MPAYKARTQGFDESMVAGYGQDDKVCVYTSLTAMMQLKSIKKTAVCIIADKEEIGSMGNTGMQSQAFDTFMSYLLNKTGENRVNLLEKVYCNSKMLSAETGENRVNLLEKVYCNSKMLSADVDAAVDPIYASVSDKMNAGYLGYGIALNKYTGAGGKYDASDANAEYNKYTGAGGKYDASDANAEYIAEVKGIFDKNNIKYQVSELGEVDIGGGGTIAYILANKGIDVID